MCNPVMNWARFMDAAIPRSFHFTDRHGSTLSGRYQRGLQHPLGLVGIVEVGDGDGGLGAAEYLKNIVGLVDEAVLIAKSVGVGPPVLGIRMVAAVGAHDRGPALHGSGTRGVVVLELVHTLESELERALGAIELEAVAILGPTPSVESSRGGLRARLHSRN